MVNIDHNHSSFYTTVSSTSNEYVSITDSWFRDLRVELILDTSIKKPNVVTEKGVFQCSEKKFKFDPEELVL